MTTNAMKAQGQLAAIADQADRIHDIVTTRLPHQHGLVAAEIAATRWLSVANNGNAATRLKKCKMQVTNFRFRVLEQGERLTRLLCDLDLVDSDGDQQIRQERKRLVLHIQDELQLADALKHKCDKLVAFHAYMFPTPVEAATPVGSPIQAEANPEKATASDNETDDDDDMEPNDDDNDKDIDMDNNDQSDEEEGEPEDESHLPVWKPRFELRDGRDGAVYLVADLTGVDLDRHFDVHVDGDVLRVSGTKLPTPRDLQVMRMTQQPTFGRFAIEETFPRHLFHLQNATLRRVSGGLVEVRVPRARVPFNARRNIYRRPAPFANMGMAW
ncbi:hypothetical protein H257_12625 [Aphanomyces astaci]|uniref:BAG domain-containing protein n=1 Tax=Aphanomyces astaci TaxID=112090 RepID=W4FYG9_APHAT|nr:hypothetical protein H257_12625 [Aphanomyces astaci]ETV72535.1 hypothetical protein H257_12625 [Aphanomyces astaci]|eukprot:XP_009838217.1 hypothetical protein H257_12625 [Aphanomyces astaci]